VGDALRRQQQQQLDLDLDLEGNEEEEGEEEGQFARRRLEPPALLLLRGAL
jgi:hypothetical protein